MISHENIIVSICCVTYNHEKYLKECLNGFVMQKTNFKFEILVNEDASTDSTADILKEYEAEYPNLFRCVYQTENQFLKQNTLTNILFPMAKGKYIALCEGDDYWTDSLKLQKQVDLLEANPNLIGCHHWQKNAILKEGEYIETDSPKIGHGYYPHAVSKVSDIFLNKIRVKTRTVMYRNIIDKNFFPDWFYKVAFGDVPLSFLMGKYGDFGFIDEEMAVYRQTETGVSKAGLTELGHKKFRAQHFKNWIEIWDYANKHYEYKYNKGSVKTVSEFYSHIFSSLGVSLVSFLSMLNYNLFKRRLSVLKTFPHTKLIFLFYGKRIGGKIKRKLLFK